MCSMSLTAVVIAYSLKVVMRFSISSGERPLVVPDRPLTTGMSISGKMSVGIVTIAEHAQEHDQQRHHDERVGPAQREPDDPHETGSSSLS